MLPFRARGIGFEQNGRIVDQVRVVKAQIPAHSGHHGYGGYRGGGAPIENRKFRLGVSFNGLGGFKANADIAAHFRRQSFPILTLQIKISRQFQCFLAKCLNGRASRGQFLAAPRATAQMPTDGDGFDHRKIIPSL